VKFFVSEIQYEIIQDNLKIDIANAIEMVDDMFLNKYDENGFLKNDFVPSYLDMVLHFGKVVGITNAKKYYPSKDEAKKKKFANFVNGINNNSKQYRAQRKALRAKSVIIDEYFKAKHNASDFN
jgi:hypothetical protein